MRMKPLLIPAFAAATLALTAQPIYATPLDDRVTELKHAVDKEAAARNNGANPQQGFVNQGMSPAFLDASIDQIVSQMENPSFGGNMDAQLAQITSMYTSTEVQEATTNLLSEIKKERKDKVDAEVAEVKTLMTKAGQAITQAKKPEDLDDLIAEMSKHQNNRYGGNPALQANQQLFQEFSSACEFVKQWQNYLAHLANGQTDQARSDLQMLSQNNYGDGLLPRSKLLELEAPDKMLAHTGTVTPVTSTPALQAQAILDGMKTLDDIKPALVKLEPLRQSDTQELQFVCNELSQMRSNYDDIKAGLPVQSNVAYNYNQNGITVPPVLRTQMLLLMLQTRFDSYKGPSPQPGEKPTDYVARVMADATTRQDWALLRDADSARNTLTQNNGLGYNISSFGGVESIISGSHQEEAGQFALAVRSYEQALQSDDPALPAKIIGDKLAAIQRDHPKEFADGMQLTVSPPGARLYQAPPMGMSNRTNPYLPPVMPPPMTAPLPASLASPSANTTTAPVPPAK